MCVRLPSWNINHKSSEETKHPNRKAGVGENDNVPHPPFPLLHQHWEGVWNVFERDDTSSVSIFWLRRRRRLLWLLEEEEDKEEAEGKEDGASPKAAVISKPRFLVVKSFCETLTVWKEGRWCSCQQSPWQRGNRPLRQYGLFYNVKVMPCL